MKSLENEYVFNEEDINDKPMLPIEPPFIANAPDAAIRARWDALVTMWENRIQAYQDQGLFKPSSQRTTEDILGLEPVTLTRQVITDGISIASVETDGPMDKAASLGQLARRITAAHERANMLLYGNATTLPVYTRIFNETPYHSRFSRVTYEFENGTLNKPDAIDDHNAAMLKARLTFEDIMQLLVAMYEQESSMLYPGTQTKQKIKSVFVQYTLDGHILPKPVHIPAAFFDHGFKGHALTTLAAARIDEFLAESSFLTDGGYEFPFNHPDDIQTRLYPNGFGCSIIDPNRVQPSGTQVNGLSKKQQDQIGHAKLVSGHAVVNLDSKMNGYCLFETMVALGKERIDVERVIYMCGSPSPKDIVIEEHATAIALIVRTNFRFFKVNALREVEEFYKTQTAFERTEDLLVCTLADRTNPDEEHRLYRHVFHMVNGSECKDAAPFEGPTIFINFDLETVADDHCVNRAWALNLMAYRMAPSVVTSSIYDARQLQMSMQCLNLDLGIWVQALRDVENTKVTDQNGKHPMKREINPDVTACAKIYYDAKDLKALKYLMDFIIRVKEISRTRELNIVLVGFNSSRFDNFILVPFCTDELNLDQSRFKVGIYGNSILTFTMFLREQGIVVSTYDLRRHLVGSLRTCCKLWGVPEGAEKGDLDHSLIQMMYDINHTSDNITLQSGQICACFDQFVEANKATIEAYCKQDVISTAVLHMIYKTSMEFIVNKHLITTHGASMGMISMIGSLSVVHKKNKLRSLVEKAMSGVTSTRGPALEIELSKIGDSKLRVGRALARIGVSARTRMYIQALRMVQPAVVADDLPFLINDFIIRGQVELEPEVQALVTEANNPATRDEAVKNLSDHLWASVGGLLVSKRFHPNIEQHPTLASFATQIFKGLCSANGFIQVGGFRYDVTKALRRHLCRAGRSEAHIGTYEDFPIFILDIVSLYPTSMICKLMEYALGAKVDDKKVVRCTYREQYVEPVDGVMKAGIWKVTVHSQPNGVVIPAQDKTGYFWDHDYVHEMTTLLTTPDIESLKMTGASFDVQDGLTFDDVTSDLYTEYISIFQSEKGRQDNLKKGLPVQLFSGELYSAGIREATKLGMNILSGKEITRPYTTVREIIHNEQVATSQDMANEQKQVKLSMQARAAIDDPAGSSLVSWRRKITKAREVPRLKEPPMRIGKNSWVAEWKKIPHTASYSHINGYHIYGMARWIMTRIYHVIGYDKFYVTETDSLAVGINDIPKLYPMKSCLGDPMVFANTERSLGLFPDAPLCPKSKQFGQLECETTEKLQEFLAKELSLEPAQIKTLEYRGSELVLNGNPTGLRGPFLCVGGKKIYAQYLLTPTGERKYIKARFKGLTFGQDWVVEPMRITMDVNGKSVTTVSRPDLFNELSVLNRKDRVRYVLTQLGDFVRPDVHRLRYSDIENYIRDKKLYVIQSRVSESSVKSMTSQQNVVLKELNLRAGGPDIMGKREIHLRSHEVQKMSMRSMARAISSCGDDVDSKCEMCDEQGSLIIDFKSFCEAHRPPEEEVRKLCKHRNKFGVPDCAEFAERDGYCINHADFRHYCDVNIYCEHEDDVNGTMVKCRELANPEGILKGINRCDKHLNQDNVTSEARCLRQYKYLKHGSLQCQDYACERAIRAGYQLCYRHHLENNGAIKERNANAIITRERANELLSTIVRGHESALASSQGHAVYCAYLLRGKTPCGKMIEVDRIGPSTIYCKRHEAHIRAVAKKSKPVP